MKATIVSQRDWGY